MSLRDDCLPLLDYYRGAMDTAFGLRRFDVVVRVSKWPPGTLPGAHGVTKIVVDTPLLVGGNGRPKVEQVSQRTIIASGGLYEDRDLRIGPLTPSYGIANGVDPSVFDPDGTSDMEVLFKLTGPGLPSTGAWYSKVGQEITSNFHYHIVIRATGATGV